MSILSVGTRLDFRVHLNEVAAPFPKSIAAPVPESPYFVENDFSERVEARGADIDSQGQQLAYLFMAGPRNRVSLEGWPYLRVAQHHRTDMGLGRV